MTDRGKEYFEAINNSWRIIKEAAREAGLTEEPSATHGGDSWYWEIKTKGDFVAEVVMITNDYFAFFPDEKDELSVKILVALFNKKKPGIRGSSHIFSERFPLTEVPKEKLADGFRKARARAEELCADAYINKLNEDSKKLLEFIDNINKK